MAQTKRINYVKTTVNVEQKPLVRPGRMKPPENLRREVIIIEQIADIDYKKIGEEITEVLEYELG